MEKYHFVNNGQIRLPLKLNPHMIAAVAVHTEVISIVSGDSLQEDVID